jgi:hypothetical protein
VYDYGIDDGLQQPELGTQDVYADIVYCIDLTSSMQPIIDKVKQTALTLHSELQNVMRNNYQRSIKQLRIKVIGFRDVYVDGPKSFEVSDFFDLPYEADEFKNFVDKLEAKGGGDVPESALEACAMAMQSDWCTTIDSSIRKRHIVVLFTDATYHDLEQSENGIDRYYPPDMPDTYSELVDMWQGQGSCANGGKGCKIDPIAARLAVFAPKVEQWKYFSDDFSNCLVQYIEPNKGGSDIKLDDILKMLGETMAA